MGSGYCHGYESVEAYREAMRVRWVVEVVVEPVVEPVAVEERIWASIAEGRGAVDRPFVPCCDRWRGEASRGLG